MEKIVKLMFKKEELLDLLERKHNMKLADGKVKMSQFGLSVELKDG